MKYLILLTLYFLYFYWEIIKNPYSIASAESIDADFGSFRLSGECWRKGRIPYDPYYYKNLPGSRTGTFYPLNIVFSWVSSFFDLDTAWNLYLFNVLLHSYATMVLAYFLFNQGLTGLFGALAWGFMAYHVKCTLWHTETFAWMTALLLSLSHQFWPGVSLGFLFLCGHPSHIFFFLYVVFILYPKQMFMALPMALLTGFPQIMAFYEYKKLSIRDDYTPDDMLAIGKMPFWAYIFMFIPWRIRDHVADVGYEEWCLYLTPVVGILALFSQNWLLWGLIIGAVILSTGKGYKWLYKLMMNQRGPYKWGYIAGLLIIMQSVNGLNRLMLADKQLTLICILTATLLLYNRETLLLYPFKAIGDRPSKMFSSPLLEWLSINAKGWKVNNLPHPVYTGQINHIETPGYTGGNHIAVLGKFLGIPKQGEAPYNWFNYHKDGEKLDAFGIKYHVGNHPPSANHKWKKVKNFGLWVNTNL